MLRKLRETLIVIFISLLIVSCSSMEIPVAVIGQDGRTLTGTNSVSMTEGSFTISDRKVTCSGTYDPFQAGDTISMPVICNDGRKGIVRAIRDTPTSGSGTFRLNDGYTGDFVFGRAALNF